MSAAAVAIPSALSSLAARLTEPEDRETYAALISYYNSLPEHDEMFRLVELLGLLALVGQHIPDALAEMLVELRAQATATSAYYTQVDTRLASLPDEIAAGVDVESMTEGMAERFRQQITKTGLENTANLLRDASKEIAGLSGQISASLKPAALAYTDTSATITRELARLKLASEELRKHNTQLMANERSNNYWVYGFMMLAILLVGLFGGIFMEKSQTTDALRNLGAQVERIQTPPAAVSVPIVAAKKTRK
jgi:hypothetical protein